jgi:hypothetical protein
VYRLHSPENNYTFHAYLQKVAGQNISEVRLVQLVKNWGLCHCLKLLAQKMKSLTVHPS